jgi:hypothetical protein
MLAILVLSPIGLLGRVGQPVGASKLFLTSIGPFCPMEQPQGTDLLSCIFLYNPKLWEDHCSAYYLLHFDFLLGLLFDPENGGNMFHQNVG